MNESVHQDQAQVVESPPALDLSLFDQQKLQRSLKHAQRSWLFRLLTLKVLPLGSLSGMRVDSADLDSCVVGLPGGWRTRNPFGSTYWAAQGMAAEAASGLFPFIYCQAATKRVNMILASCEASFVRQCKGRATFRCEGGASARAAVALTIETGERQLCEHQVIGYDSSGEVVSEWTFVWSLKVSSRG